MSDATIENKQTAPLPEEVPSIDAIRGELAKLFDLRHPGPMLGRWAILGCMVAGITEIVQIIQH